MSSPIVPNGHDAKALVPHVAVPNKPLRPRMSKKRIQMLLDQLAVPFDPLVIQWRVVETTRIANRFRGRVIPYADRLAYLDRLNRVLTPAGWSSNLFVHPSIIAPTERGRGAAPAKVVVTCQLTIHGLGSHSSTGEEWALDENAATCAEAQALKRACANFGLGAYLYYFFRGVWVDLDGKKQLQTPPQLPAWATPEGWEAGARPSIERVRDMPDATPNGLDPNMIRAIEALQNDLGPVYRRILKRYRVWEPNQITDSATAAQVLADMQAAAPLMLRAAYALERLGKPAFDEVMKPFNIKSPADFGDFGVLERVVAALEAKVNRLDVS